MTRGSRGHSPIPARYPPRFGCCSFAPAVPVYKVLRRSLVYYFLAAGKLPPPPPFSQCAGVLPDKSITSLALCNTQAMTRQSAQDYFDNTWALTEVLFAGLKSEDAFFCPPGHGALTETRSPPAIPARPSAIGQSASPFTPGRLARRLRRECLLLRRWCPTPPRKRPISGVNHLSMAQRPFGTHHPSPGHPYYCAVNRRDLKRTRLKCMLICYVAGLFGVDGFLS